MTDLDTGFALLMRYRAPVITLETAIKDFLPHISIEQAKRRAGVQTLPFPAFRAEASQKSPYLVNVADLATWLEKSREEATGEWQKIHS